ncbi:exported hypothetical protein [Candidatus Xenohaliotis californiensis]|uniref:Thioredoxin domain-containing protein n=1 Tax=Candidatus Xenohaliotis californiensis TaxID=84677 RepID=A0ABM9N952_9RICK|nr:exported hypothetical protein [Candidatus Xenohaliotis californiensis]
MNKFYISYILLALSFALVTTSNDMLIFNDLDAVDNKNNNNNISLFAPFNRVAIKFFVADDDNNLIFSDNLKGRIVLVYLWSTWCMDCIKGLQTLNKLTPYLKETSLQNVDILPIAIGSTVQQAKEFYMQNNIKNLRLFFDVEHNVIKTFSRLNIETIPSLILIDTNSLVAAVHIGILQSSVNYLYNFIGELSEQD